MTLILMSVEENSEEDLNDVGEDLLYSIYDGKKSNKPQQKYRGGVTNHADGQSKACVSISIKRGRLTLVHPTLVSAIQSYLDHVLLCISLRQT